jgi:hypothetical protein
VKLRAEKAAQKGPIVLKPARRNFYEGESDEEGLLNTLRLYIEINTLLVKHGLPRNGKLLI